MRNKKNTLYIILAVIVVIVGIVILSKDNSKDKKDETETTKTEQTTEVKKATDQPTATEKIQELRQKQQISKIKFRQAHSRLLQQQKNRNHEHFMVFGVMLIRSVQQHKSKQ